MELAAQRGFAGFFARWLPSVPLRKCPVADAHEIVGSLRTVRYHHAVVLSRKGGLFRYIRLLFAYSQEPLVI